MKIIQCQFCKKPFPSLVGRVCPECVEKIDKDFFKVRDYIYEHKQTNIDIVAEETEVSKQVIMHLLKQGRLSFDTPDGGGLLHCEMCKKSINTGRLCKGCKGKVAVSLDNNVSGSSQHYRGGGEQQHFRGSAKISGKD